MIRKSAATMGETVGLGAGSGAAVGALTALLEERPDLHKVLKNALIGGAGGAAIGAGAHALKGNSPVSPNPDILPDKMSGNTREMNLALAAMSGFIPGVGPSLHGGLSQGVGQGVASGAASLAGPLAVLIPALRKAEGFAAAVPTKTRALAGLASILGATGAAAVGNHLRTKEAAEVVRKTKMVEEHHDHCPHCDHEFGEKGGPRPVNLPEDSAERDKVFASGDYDEACPACGGIVDRKEMTDAEIDSPDLGYFFSGDEAGKEKFRQQLRTQRENQRRRKAEREKSAAVVTSCGQVGRLLQGDEALHALLRMPGFRPAPRYAALGAQLRKSASAECPCSLATTDDIYTCRCYGNPMIKSKGWTKSASAKCPGCGDDFPEGEPLPDVEMCERCERFGKPKSASLRAAVTGGLVKSALRPIEERLQRLAERRGECVVCWKPNQEGLVCDCGKTEGAEKSAKEAPGIRQARNATHTDPTPAQASAGNYAKGEFDFKGITIKIENPKGTERRGYDAKGAITWRRTMAADYGYVKGSKAIDGDAIDVFVGPDHDSDLIVVIDQYRGDTFDESKFVVGVTSKEQGEKLYLQHYPRSWKLGPVSTTTVPQFKAWLKDGDHKKPFQGQLVKAASISDTVGGWLKGDDEGRDWRWGLLGAPLVTLPVGLGAKAYSDHVIPRVAGAPKGQKERAMYRALVKMVEDGGIEVVPANKSKMHSMVDAQPRAGEMIRHALGLPQKPLELGSAYSPMTEEILMAKGQKSPGILAHELGHMRGGSGLFAANVIGKHGLGLLPTLGLLSPNESTGNAAAWTGTALGGGVLASEVDASRRGYQAIRGLGGGRAAALKAFIGLPTYAAAASIPMLAHHLKKRLGGYDYSITDALSDVVHGDKLGPGLMAKSAGVGQWLLRGLMSPFAQRIMRSRPFQQVEKAVVTGAGNVADHVLQHPKAYGPLARHAGKLTVAGGIGAATSPLWAPKIFRNPQQAAQPGPSPSAPPPDGPEMHVIPPPSGITATRG